MSKYTEELKHTLRGAMRLAELSDAEQIDHDLPAYLVFMILANTRKLKQVSPDHILVKAVTAALEAQPAIDPAQTSFNL